MAHECIIDIRPLKAQTASLKTDIAAARWIMAFMHQPCHFPVAGTLMIEPTESGKQSRD